MSVERMSRTEAITHAAPRQISPSHATDTVYIVQNVQRIDFHQVKAGKIPHCGKKMLKAPWRKAHAVSVIAEPEIQPVGYVGAVDCLKNDMPTSIEGHIAAFQKPDEIIVGKMLYELRRIDELDFDSDRSKSADRSS